MPPVIRPMRGSSEQLVHVGDPIILRFIISEAVPLVPVNNITWYFTSISGQQTTLSCPGHSPKYRFSAHCLTLTIGDASISDGGLYEVFVFTRAGENSSRIAVIITGGEPICVTLITCLYGLTHVQTNTNIDVWLVRPSFRKTLGGRGAKCKFSRGQVT